MKGNSVQVEVQLILGVESVSIVGLLDTSVNESKERVMVALYAYDISLQDKKWLFIYPQQNSERIALSLICYGNHDNERGW